MVKSTSIKTYSLSLFLPLLLSQFQSLHPSPYLFSSLTFFHSLFLFIKAFLMVFISSWGSFSVADFLSLLLSSSISTSLSPSVSQFLPLFFPFLSFFPPSFSLSFYLSLNLISPLNCSGTILSLFSFLFNYLLVITVGYKDGNYINDYDWSFLFFINTYYFCIKAICG